LGRCASQSLHEVVAAAAQVAQEGLPCPPTRFAALRRRIQATGSPPAATLVVLEATGNYWVALAIALHEAGYPVSVVNPR